MRLKIISEVDKGTTILMQIPNSYTKRSVLMRVILIDDEPMALENFRYVIRQCEV